MRLFLLEAMLDLLQTYTRSPDSRLHHLLLPKETLLLYSVADSIIVLSAPSLSLRRVLAFWEAFPGLLHSNGAIHCLSVDSGMNLIIAAMGSRVAAWSLSNSQNSLWRVHSSLVLPNSLVVTALDSKSGLLAVGSQDTLSVYTLILEDDLPTWSKKWFFSVVSPSLIRFSPSLTYIATSTKNDNAVRIYNTASGRINQSISHPRPVKDLMWRMPQISSRDDLMLYTVTSDSTLRIFLPVLDQPHHLQLHGSLDLFSSLPLSVISQSSFDPSFSNVFKLDRNLISLVFSRILGQLETDKDSSRLKKLREITGEGWDLFLRVMGDGSLVVSAVANIDRRPPTLLRNIILVHSAPGLLSTQPSNLHVLPVPEEVALTLVTSSPLASFELSPFLFFDGQPEGLKPIIQKSLQVEASRISKFVRTPDGQSIGVVRENGGEIWTVHKKGSCLSRKKMWSQADLVVVLEKGALFATYDKSESALTLHTSPPVSLTIPKVNSLFSVPFGKQNSILGIAEDYAVIKIHVEFSPPPSLSLDSVTQLPLSFPPIYIVPVDPMAWAGPYKDTLTEHDLLLGVSEDGELTFWIPNDGTLAAWRCTGRVRTGRRGLRKVCCSSAKKSVLVVPTLEGEELTIWDSKESEFASGLEYSGLISHSEPVNDLDWTATPDSQSILAVGYSHRVEILCQRRMTYFDDDLLWEVCWRVEIGNIIPHHIVDSIWLAHGSLLIGAGQNMLLYGQPKQTNDKGFEDTLFEHVARHNGPLDDFHPQMLLQCLLWGKVELVKDIIVLLAHHLKAEKGFDEWIGIPVDKFFSTDTQSPGLQKSAKQKPQYASLFDDRQVDVGSREDDGFTRNLVEELLDRIETRPLPHLTPNEHAHLLVLIQATLEIEEQRRALDANGLRYLISMRSFYILNKRSSTPGSPDSKGSISRRTGSRDRLRYRDMIWAFHSESQQLLLSSSVTACDGRMKWSDARSLGIFLWLKSQDMVKSHLEVIGRNEYMANDKRDPTECSLFYFALGKTKLVHGLWRQAVWHKEQAIMLKFLSNDFSQAHWRTAALKNAYSLLSKQRFEYAAAFFLLGGSLKDAIIVCLSKLFDFQLAIALARAVEGDDGPELQNVLRTTVVSLAFKDGNRWLASWAFWFLHRRDLAVRVLVTPLQDIASIIDIKISNIGDPHYDDPSLALLFNQLKLKTLQTAKGTSEISGRTEFNFVLQTARVFCRMGCHVLALDLVRSWSFVRPAVPRTSPPGANFGLVSAPSPATARHSQFGIDTHLRRQSSILIDMEVSSDPSTRRASPAPPSESMALVLDHSEEKNENESDSFARKAGMGNLLKSAKQNVQVPEFDMNSFF